VFSELGFRTPILLASLCLLALGGPALRRVVGLRSAVAWSWLLALSPLLVIYGRMVRSYGVLLPLTVAAVFCFFRWWQTGARVHAVGYAVFGAIAIWFHLGAGPLVIAPLAFAVAELAISRARGESAPRRLRELGAAALLLACLGALLLLPARETLWELAMRKAGAAAAGPAVLLEVAQLASGVASVGLAVIFWLLAAAGLVALARRNAAFARLTAVLVGGQLLGLWLLAPKLDSPLLASRAVLVALPWVLLWVACGLGALASVAARLEPRAAAVPAVALLAVLFASGPFARGDFWRSSFQQHDDHLLFSRARPGPDPETVPAFYRSLSDPSDSSARRGERSALVEFPWHPFWGFGHAVPSYQEAIHGRRVRVSNAEPFTRDRRLALHNFVAFTPAALLASDAAWAVVHLDLEAEERRARERLQLRVKPREREWQVLRALAAVGSADLEGRFGPPDHREEALVAWDLVRLRAEAIAR
jgi:hypothetical protein